MGVSTINLAHGVHNVCTMYRDLCVYRKLPPVVLS